jgi:hypothetical protein
MIFWLGFEVDLDLDLDLECWDIGVIGTIVGDFSWNFIV